MPIGIFRRAATAGVLSFTLVAGAVAPANAQLDGTDSLPLGAAAELLDAVGSSGFPPIGGASVEDVTPPRVLDEPIEKAEFVSVANAGETYEYWTIRSAAMQREVTVEVIPSRESDTAPVLYLLDGIGAAEGITGWRDEGQIAEKLVGKNVHVVNPTGAPGSYYADWIADDPVLGTNKWETFLTKELPGIVNGQLSTTGKSAIGGISMGAQAAMHLAAHHPELYSGVMAFSGNYSTMDELGHQTIRLSVGSRGGNPDNMWGPHGSDEWKHHDTLSHAEKLDGTAVYFSVGTGAVGPDDLEEYGERVDTMIFGGTLELGAYEGTKNFERALDRAGVAHKVDYSDTGMHNWPNFIKNFDAGWAHIEPSLRS